MNDDRPDEGPDPDEHAFPTDSPAIDEPAGADPSETDLDDVDGVAASADAPPVPGETPPSAPPSGAQGAVPPPPGFGGPTPGAGPASAPRGPRRLTRSRDRKLGGVAGGIAEYLGIDPTLVRLGFLLAIFIGGAGVIAYVVAWIVLPENDGTSSGGTGQAPMRIRRDGSGIDTTTALAVGLLVFAVLFGLASADGGQVLVPIAMIAGGIWLLSQRESSRAERDSPTTLSQAASAAAPMAGTTAFEADDTGRFAQRWEQPATDPLGTTIFPDPDPRTHRTPEPRPPALVTRVTLSLLALLAAGAIAANELDLFDVTVPGVLAVALVVVGIGAITAAFVGRGRGLVPVGVLVALSFAGASTVQPLVDDGTGQRSYAPTSAAEVRDSYALGIGELDVDLSAVTIAPGTTVETTVDLGIGSAEVLVPDDVEVVVDGEVAIGDLRIFEFQENGFGNDIRRTRSAEDADTSTTSTTTDGDDLVEPGTLVIRLDVGIGEGVVRNG